MRFEMTYFELMNIDQDIKQQSHQSPAFRFFNAAKIENFRKRNYMALTLLSRKTVEIKKAWCLLDEKNEPLTKDGANGGKEVVYPNDDAKKKCTEELTEFLNRSVTVEF